MMRLPEPYGSCVDPTISNKERNVYEELHPGVQYSTLVSIRQSLSWLYVIIIVIVIVVVVFIIAAASIVYSSLAQ